MLHPARRSTDCWLIPARSANQSFEPLDRAPPRGIHHHFVRPVTERQRKRRERYLDL
jgi:hypothetical protein